MLPLIKLYFMSWWRGFVGPFFAFAFPPLILIMLGQFTPYNVMAPPYILYAGITLGVQTLSIALTGFKNSSLIKRIGQTPITRKGFILSLFLFNILLILVAILWIIFVMFLYQQFNLVKLTIKIQNLVVENQQVSNQPLTISARILWSKVQWGWVAIIAIIGTILSTSIGMFLGTIAKSVEAANGLSLIVYFIFSFLGGIFFPLTLIKKAPPLEYSSLAVPFRFLSESINQAFKGNFAITNQFEITKSVVGGVVVSVYEIGPLYIYLAIPLVIAVILIILSIKLFRWE